MLEVTGDNHSFPKHQSLLDGQPDRADHGTDPVWPTVGCSVATGSLPADFWIT